MIFPNPKDILAFYISRYLKDGDTAVDATAGNGADTAALLRAVGNGKVYAFDIQQKAIEAARRAVNNDCRAKFILDSHAEMDKYVPAGIRCAVFNLGYLPGGDHSIATKAGATIEAIGKACSLLGESGFIAVTMYRGGDSGYEEFEAVSSYLASLAHREWNVLRFDYFNRPNDPPVLAVVERKNTNNFFR